MNPLINGTDGRKMSSSWGNTINLLAEPNDMYGKVMSMQDSEILPYLTICTRVPLEEIALIKEQLDGGSNPRDAKMRLAREIVSLYHGAEAGMTAQEAFTETFQKGVIPEDVVEIEKAYIENMIVAGVVASKSELTRLLEAGGVRNAESGEKIDSIPESVGEPTVLKIGKRRFVKLMP
jgi:tyrosyl-tRNA synthetase